jgi:VanZ family protein
MPAICVTESKSTSPIATKKTYIAYIPAVVVAAGIAVLSLIERPDRIMVVHASDKVLHGLMYALWAVTVMVGAWCNGHRSWSAYAAVTMFVTAYGTLMEWLQYACTVSRSGEWLDIVADLVGALVGVGVTALCSLIWQRRNTSTTSR